MGLSASRNSSGSPGGQLPGATPLGQMQPFQYPRLQHMAQNGPFGGILARVMMHGLEQRRLRQGMNPQEWQNQLDARINPQLPPQASPTAVAATSGLPGMPPMAPHYRSFP